MIIFIVLVFDTVQMTSSICAFFLETTRPGLVTKRSLVLTYLLFIAFLPIYIVCPSDKVVFGEFLLAAMAGILTLVIIPFNVIRYNKFLADNLSYTKGVSVNRFAACACIYFLSLIIYALCFWNTTWLGEVVYDVFSIALLGVMCYISFHHKVVAEMLQVEGASVEGASAGNVKEELQDERRDAGNVKEQFDDENKSQRDNFIATALLRCMDKEKLYLNPLLSLNDLSQAVGSNKTYISSFINSQGKTFYDYVNEYRVSEACSIMDMSAGRLSMAEVASRSGFNSISSFNRYFLKIKGVTPTNYYRRRS